jgi:hypothetical protein
MVITVLADVAAGVGNPEQVKTLYELLRPNAALVAGADHIRFGSVSRYLGLLAAALPGSMMQPYSFGMQWKRTIVLAPCPGARTPRPIWLRCCWFAMRQGTARQPMTFFVKLWRPSKSSV